VLLTTQYLDEADQLADRVVVIDHGRTIAEGTPEALKAQVGGDRLEVAVTDLADLPAATAVLAAIGSGPPEVDADAGRVSARVDDRVAAIGALVRELEAADVAVADLGLRRPTLDDVFLHLTGRSTEAGTDEEAA